MAESVMKGYFPSQVVSDAEKVGAEYGLQVAKIINKNSCFCQAQSTF